MVTHLIFTYFFQTLQETVIKALVVSKEPGASITNMLVANEGDIDDGIIVVEDRFMDDNSNEGIDFGKHESEGNNQPWQANEDPAKVAKVINLDGDKQKVQLDPRMRCRMTWLFLHNLILRLCCHLSYRYLSEEMTLLEVTVKNVMVV